MIFDSSIWIDYLRGNKTSSTDLLDRLLNEYTVPNVHLCPAIFQEILQGINQLQLDSYFAAENAATLYRSLRIKGITIRKPNDCLIAFYAIHFKLELVHNDKDFNKIAKHTSLKIYSA
jgi:predicted nucleic acid-binding protein